MDALIGIKTYCKVISSLAAATSAIVECRDTSGNLLDCDFAYVESAAGILGTGYMHVQVSSSDRTIYHGPDVTETPTLFDASGAGGALISAKQGGAIVISSPNYFNALAITSVLSTTSDILVTYGVRQKKNLLRNNAHKVVGS